MHLPEEMIAAASAGADYAMLRAALAAVQARRPAARDAGRAPGAAVDPRAAIHALVAGDAAGFAAAARVLGHRFAATDLAGRLVNEDERRLYRGISAFLESPPVQAPPATGRAPGAWPRAADRG